MASGRRRGRADNVMTDDRDKDRPAPPYEYEEGDTARRNFDSLMDKALSTKPEKAPAPPKK